MLFEVTRRHVELALADRPRRICPVAVALAEKFPTAGFFVLVSWTEFYRLAGRPTELRLLNPVEVRRAVLAFDQRGEMKPLTCDWPELARLANTK